MPSQLSSWRTKMCNFSWKIPAIQRRKSATGTKAFRWTVPMGNCRATNSLKYTKTFSKAVIRKSFASTCTGTTEPPGIRRSCQLQPKPVSSLCTRTFDEDGNGWIDFKEFLLAIGITTSTNAREKLKWAFKVFTCPLLASVVTMNDPSPPLLLSHRCTMLTAMVSLSWMRWRASLRFARKHFDA